MEIFLHGIRAGFVEIFYIHNACTISALFHIRFDINIVNLYSIIINIKITI